MSERLCRNGGVMTYRRDEGGGGGDYAEYNCTCADGYHYVMLAD